MKKALCIILAAILMTATAAGCSLFNKDAELKLDQTELSMTVGDTAQLNAGDASKVKWTSSNEAVATVHGGTVNARSAGTADITVSAEDGASQVCRVTVTDKLITTISLSVKSIRLGLGKTVQINATYSPADASQTGLSWSSEDESIAKVDENGFVTGCSDGTTNIICRSSNGVSASCAVTVSEAPEAPTDPPATAKPTAAATEATSATKPAEKGETPTVTPSYSGDYLFPESSTRMLSESEVKDALSSMSGASVSGSFSQDAVNEIFARHGYIFRTSSIKAYYESKSWYTPNPNFSMSDLSEIEEYNISLFGKY